MNPRRRPSAQAEGLPRAAEADASARRPRTARRSSALRALPLLCVLGSLAAAPALAQAPDESRALELVRVAIGLREQGLRDRAIATCDDFLQRFGASQHAPLVRYTRAQCLFELERWDEAAKSFAEVAKLHPTFSYVAEARFREGEARYRNGELELAFPVLQAFLAQHAEHYLLEPALFLAAESAFRTSRFEEGEALYRRYLAGFAKGEHAEESRMGLVWSLFRQKRWADAQKEIDALQPARKPEGPQGELLFLLGECAFQLGQDAEAIAAFTKVPAGHEYGDDALSARAYALARSGKKEEAAERFAELARAMPSSPLAADARLRAGLLFAEVGKADKARALLGELPSGDPAGEQQAQLALGEVALKEKRAADAERHFQSAIAGPDAATRDRARLGLADALAAQGRREEAAKLYAAAAEASGGEADYALASLVAAEFNAQRWQAVVDAARRFEQRHAQSSHRAGVLYALAEGLFALEQWSEARAAFATLAEVDAKRAPQAALRIAWTHYRAGEVDAALKSFGDYVRSYPSDAGVGEAYAVLGRVQLERKQPEAAERFYREARGRELGAYADECQLGLARALAQRGMAEEALREYDAFAKSFDGSKLLARALYEAAELRFQRKDYAEAGKLYETLRQRFAQDELAPYALHGAGWCALQGGDAKLAEQCARELSQRAPEPLATPALELLAAALRSQGRGAEAAEIYARVASATGGSERSDEAALRAAVLRREAGEHERALADLKALLASRPNFSGRERALYELALAARGAKAEAEAEAAWRELASKHGSTPQGSEARFQLGEIAYAAGKYGEADTWYAAAIEAPRDAALKALASYKRGWTLLKLERFADAAVEFDRVGKTEPEGELTGESLFLAGEALYRAKDLDGARERLKRVLREFPGHEVSSRALFRLGQAEGEKGEWNACQETLRQLVDAHPDFKLLAEARLWIGRSLRELGHAARALEALDAAEPEAKGKILAQVKIEAGRCLLALERADDAFGRFVAVKYSFSDLPAELAAANFYAGESMLAKKDAKGAATFYKEVVEKFASEPFAKRAADRLREIERQ
ncbi:MAG: tetratricopeptide repeat protein [Planctomycetes bacterium]|nr:tetratricopeptide repeat protein [Planctomycetota bacterium]